MPNGNRVDLHHIEDAFHDPQDKAELAMAEHALRTGPDGTASAADIQRAVAGTMVGQTVMAMVDPDAIDDAEPDEGRY